ALQGAAHTAARRGAGRGGGPAGSARRARSEVDRPVQPALGAHAAGSPPRRRRPQAADRSLRRAQRRARPPRSVGIRPAPPAIGSHARAAAQGPCSATGAAEKMITLRSLEQRVGQEVGVSPWVEMTQQRIDTFAKAIEDFQWIHVDRERAKASPFGGTIAHGFLTLSLLSHLSEATFSFSDRRMGINYGLNKVRFTSPVRAGSRVRARFSVSRYEKLDPDGVQITWNVVVEIEGAHKPALVAEW